MKVQVLGIQKVDYFNKQQRHIQGATFHVCSVEPEDSPQFYGRRVAEVFLNSEIIGNSSVKVGDHIRLFSSQRLGSNYAYYSGFEILSK